ncbi:MAG TPA: AI-2E family transporter [Gemmatimonadota bacterium]|nr:AI-2E family transporter [Gemmatimonadota bacterium]
MTDDEERSGTEGEEPPQPDIRKLAALWQGPVDIRSLALTGTFVLLLFYTLYFAKSFFMPIFLATLLNFLLGPAVRGLKRIGIPQAMGSALVIFAVLGAVGYGVYRLSGPAAEWFEKAPEGLRRAELRVRQIQQPVEGVRQAAQEVEEQVERITGGERVRPQEVKFEDGTIAGALMSRTQAFLAGAVIMLILLYFLLASGDLFLRKLVRVLPTLSDKKRAIEIARETERHVSTYLATITLINVGLGVLVAVAMHFAGMPNPVLWGVTAGLLNYVPYLGAMITVGVLTVVSVLTFEGLGRALLAPGIYVVINGLEGYLVTPTMLGRRLTLNPVVIFVGLIFWGWLWGIPGALLAVPILATFKIVCDHIEPLAPIGEFLGR